jgi:hypothetical protein
LRAQNAICDDRPLEITGLYEKQFGTGGGMSRTNAYDLVTGTRSRNSISLSRSKTRAPALAMEQASEEPAMPPPMILVTGPSADARRAHALPLIGQDKTRIPDLVFSGPDAPLAPDARARLFGEDVAPA